MQTDGMGYLNRWIEDPDDFDDDERLWRCPDCGAVGDRHHAQRERPFCPNCDARDAVLIEMKPIGPGAEDLPRPKGVRDA
jgi:hypothetical protein